MIKLKSLMFGVSIALVAGTGFVGGSLDTGVKGFVSFHEAEAGPYRRSVRRTSRRTARRTSRRHSYYGGGYYGGAAVAAGAAVVTAVAIGTIVASLPPSCSTVITDGVTYHNCSGTWYRPQGSQYIVVNAP
jgi:hypothetical protein